jgi:hypothetical protein
VITVDGSITASERYSGENGEVRGWGGAADLDAFVGVGVGVGVGA